MSKYQYTQTYNSEKKREELDFTIPSKDFETYTQKALKQIAAETTVPGFRKGKAPEGQVLRLKYNEISEKAVNIAINEALQSIEKLDPQPLDQLEVSKILFNEANDLQVTLSYIPTPSVVLGDITKVKAPSVEAQKATNEEVEKEMANLWFFYAKKSNPEIKKEDFSVDKLDEGFFNNEELKKDYPDITSVESLQKFLEDYINATYEAQAKTAYENEIVNEVIKVATFDKVDPLIDKELERRVENYKARFSSIGMNADEYMSKNNLSDEDLKKDWKEQAERDVKLELVLQKYGQEHNIEPTEEEVHAQIEQLDENTKKMYAGNHASIHALVRYYYINQKAYTELVDAVAGKTEQKGETRKESTEKKEKSKKK